MKNIAKENQIQLMNDLMNRFQEVLNTITLEIQENSQTIFGID